MYDPKLKYLLGDEELFSVDIFYTANKFTDSSRSPNYRALLHLTSYLLYLRHPFELSNPPGHSEGSLATGQSAAISVCWFSVGKNEKDASRELVLP